MATITYYSDSEEFLMGISTGIADFAGEWATAEPCPEPSNHPQYQWMLVVDDEEVDVDQCRYFNGASFDYVE